jgi:hypothetical protein
MGHGELPWHTPLMKHACHELLLQLGGSLLEVAGQHTGSTLTCASLATASEPLRALSVAVSSRVHLTNMLYSGVHPLVWTCWQVSLNKYPNWGLKINILSNSVCLEM